MKNTQYTFYLTFQFYRSNRNESTHNISHIFLHFLYLKQLILLFPQNPVWFPWKQYPNKETTMIKYVNYQILLIYQPSKLISHQQKQSTNHKTQQAYNQKEIPKTFPLSFLLTWNKEKQKGKSCFMLDPHRSCFYYSENL